MNNLNKKIVTMFNLGNVPISGTISSILVMPIFYFMKKWMGAYLFLLTFMLLLPYTIEFCNKAYKQWGDDRRIVLDEVVGVAVMFIFIRDMTLVRVLVSLIFFRLFDIFKPWPMSYWDKNGGDLGVVADDFMAGILAGALSMLI